MPWRFVRGHGHLVRRRWWAPPASHELLHRAPIYASDHEVVVHTRSEDRDYLFGVDPHTLPLAD